jgi:hypothetical protein
VYSVLLVVVISRVQLETKSVNIGEDMTGSRYHRSVYVGGSAIECAVYAK